MSVSLQGRVGFEGWSLSLFQEFSSDGIFHDKKEVETVVETYNASEQRLYYIDEAAFGATPVNPTMLSVPEDSIEPSIDPGNIRLRGAGSGDLMAIKKGLRAATLKLCILCRQMHRLTCCSTPEMSLTRAYTQLLYFKGVFSVATDIISLLLLA
jgi:hypothetical protein